MRVCVRVCVYGLAQGDSVGAFASEGGALMEEDVPLGLIQTLHCEVGGRLLPLTTSVDPKSMTCLNIECKTFRHVVFGLMFASPSEVKKVSRPVALAR